MDNSLNQITHSPTLKLNLERVSLYLTAYETLKSAIIDRVKGFYSDHWRINDLGELEGEVSSQYKTRVITLQPKDELTACCLFLKEVDCFTDTHIETVKRLRKHRNSIAHEIVAYISKPNRKVEPEFISDIYKLVKHIDIWWLREFEMSIDPDWTPEKMATVRWDEVVGGYSFLLDLILPIFDGDTKRLDDLHAQLSHLFPSDECTAP